MVLLQQQQVEEGDEGDGCNCFDGILEHNDKLYPKRERERMMDKAVRGDYESAGWRCTALPPALSPTINRQAKIRLPIKIDGHGNFMFFSYSHVTRKFYSGNHFDGLLLLSFTLSFIFFSNRLHCCYIDY